MISSVVDNSKDPSSPPSLRETRQNLETIWYVTRTSQYLKNLDYDDSWIVKVRELCSVYESGWVAKKTRLD